MKSHFILLLILAFVACGCSSTRRMVAQSRANAIPANEMTRAIVIESAKSPVAGLLDVKHVVVIARDALDVQGAATQWPQPPTPELDLATRHFIESHLQRAMMEKGYRAANRMNVIPVRMERSFPLGDMSVADLRALVKPHHMLLCTRVRQNISPERYLWDRGSRSDNREFHLGERITYCFTLELLSCNTSEPLWTATATVDSVFKQVPDRLHLLRAIVEELVARVPPAQGLVTK